MWVSCSPAQELLPQSSGTLEFVCQLLAGVTALVRAKQAPHSLDAFVATQGHHQNQANVPRARHLHWKALPPVILITPLEGVWLSVFILSMRKLRL